MNLHHFLYLVCKYLPSVFGFHMGFCEIYGN